MIWLLNTVHTQHDRMVFGRLLTKNEAIKDLIREGRESVSVKKDPKYSVKGLN
ncbi:Uncharacterised protein [Plesiomonas shigelloides]|nr:Uncharacterised protein [Plesiomonas shigelloides]